MTYWTSVIFDPGRLGSNAGTSNQSLRGMLIRVLLADGRSPRRAAIAAGTALYFALTIPWWGQWMLGRPDVPVLAARAVQDGFGIAGLLLAVIIAWLPGATQPRPADPPMLA